MLIWVELDCNTGNASLGNVDVEVRGIVGN